MMTTRDMIREIRALGADLDVLRREHDRLAEKAEREEAHGVDDIDQALHLIGRRVSELRRRLRGRTAATA